MTYVPPHYWLIPDAHPTPQGGRWRFALLNQQGHPYLAVEDIEPGECSAARLELTAVARGLEALDGPTRVTVLAKSQHVLEGLRYALPEWKANAWQWECFNELTPVKNADLWRRVDRAMTFHQVSCQSSSGREWFHPRMPAGVSPAGHPAREVSRSRMPALSEPETHPAESIRRPHFLGTLAPAEQSAANPVAILGRSNYPAEPVLARPTNWDGALAADAERPIIPFPIASRTGAEWDPPSRAGFADEPPRRLTVRRSWSAVGTGPDDLELGWKPDLAGNSSLPSNWAPQEQGMSWKLLFRFPAWIGRLTIQFFQTLGSGVIWLARKFWERRMPLAWRGWRTRFQPGGIPTPAHP